MTEQDTQNVEVQSRPAEIEPRPEEAISPLVDIYETEDGTVTLEIELPGVTTDQVDLRVDKGVLTVQANAAPRDHGEQYTETYRGFSVGNYFRAFALSDEVDREKIDASLDDGVLTVTLPRAETAQTKKIEIKS